MIRRSTHIYLGEDRIVLQPRDTSPTGPGFAGAPIHSLAHSASIEEILTELEKTLADCKMIPEPNGEAFKKLVDPLLAATGEKTWHAICRAFANINVQEEPGELVFSPWIPHYGWFSESRKYWRCDKTDRQEMGSALLAAARIAVEEQNLNNPPPFCSDASAC